MKKVVVYTMDQCPFCEAAKKLLKERNIQFSEIRLGDDDAEWEELNKKSGMRTVPQIFVDEKLIGGFEDLARLDKKDHLKGI